MASALQMANVARIGIMIATHGDLACALLRTVELIAGPQAGVVCVSLPPDETPDAFRSRLAAELSPTEPTLILVDMPGGSPWNIAAGLAATSPQVRVVSGVNLPMLLEVALSREGMNVDQLARTAQEAGALAVKQYDA
jgi:mannose/fructose/sorbose-specific phosphotransferase system IIA component